MPTIREDSFRTPASSPTERTPAAKPGTGAFINSAKQGSKAARTADLFEGSARHPAKANEISAPQLQGPKLGFEVHEGGAASDLGGEQVDLTRYTSDAKTRAAAMTVMGTDPLWVEMFQERARAAQADHPTFAGVPEEDLVLLGGYMQDKYVIMNDALRKGEDSPELWKANENLAEGVKAVASALHQLPAFEGVVYRGVPAKRLDQYVDGQVVTEKGFTSTSAEQEVAEGFGEGLLVIQSGRNGKDVSPMADPMNQHEKEILFPPGTRFKVLSKEKDPSTGRTTVFLQEVL